jgi:hypothetical protein
MHNDVRAIDAAAQASRYRCGTSRPEHPSNSYIVEHENDSNATLKDSLTEEDQMDKNASEPAAGRTHEKCQYNCWSLTSALTATPQHSMKWLTREEHGPPTRKQEEVGSVTDRNAEPVAVLLIARSNPCCDSAL